MRIAIPVTVIGKTQGGSKSLADTKQHRIDRDHVVGPDRYKDRFEHYTSSWITGIFGLDRYLIETILRGVWINMGDNGPVRSWRCLCIGLFGRPVAPVHMVQRARYGLK